MMNFSINEVDSVEILTLQDNYIDILSGDSTEILQRALPFKGSEIRNSLVAEHGFSAIVTIKKDHTSHRMLFDFGFSEHGAALNADTLDVDLTSVEEMALSHGHMDHRGGLKQLVERVGRKDMTMVLHPAAFRQSRYIQFANQSKTYFPPFDRKEIQDMGITLVETSAPYPLLNDHLLFLGEIPRTNGFEHGMPNVYYEENGVAMLDPIEDDTSIIANIKGKGLVILSGCAHSGIINTVTHARKVTGVDKVFAVMGGFHLTGPHFADIIEPTTDALKQFNPKYVIPTHCTGRNAVMHIEKEMGDQFLLNMVGTKLIFSS